MNKFEDEVNGKTTEGQQTEATSKRVHIVSSKLEIIDNAIKFAYNIKGLPAPVEFVINPSEIEVQTQSNLFSLKAIAAGLLGKVQTAYAGEKDPAAIAEILAENFAAFASGVFENRNFGEKKLVLPDVVIAWMRHVGKDTEDREQAQKYLEAYNKKSPEEKRKFSLNKAIIEQLQILATERLAAKAEKAEDSDLEVLD